MKKIKTVISLIYLFFGVFTAVGQEYKVASMSIDQRDLTARTNKRIDNNGTACAVLKIFVPDKITKVEGNIIGPIESDGIQKLVYVTAGSKQINLLFENHYPLRIVFDDYNIPTVSERMVYVIKLVEAGENPSITESSLNVTVSEDDVLRDAIGAYENEQYNDAVTLFKRIPNNAKAQEYLYLCYEFGRGVEASEADAKYWLRKAAENENAGCQYMLFIKSYKSGLSEDGIHWLKRAASNGYPNAVWDLGVMYYLGNDLIPQNLDAAVYWWKKAAEQGNANAINNLKNMGEI